MLAIGWDSEVAGYPVGGIVAATLYGALLTFALISFLTRRAHRPTEVTTWARARGVRLTARTRPLVRAYVSLSITCRGIGAVGGIYLGYAFDRAFGVDTSSGAQWWTWVIGGWTAGALWAQHQVTATRTAPSAASLTPRRLADYLPRALHWAPAAAAAVVAATTAVAWMAADRRSGPSEPPPPSWGSLATRVLFAALLAGAVALAEQRIVGRRQAALEPDLLAADDAIRNSAIHQVAGAGTAMIFTLGIANLTAEPFSGGPLPLALVPVGFMALAFFSWQYVAYRAWRVRRSDATASPADAVSA